MAVEDFIIVPSLSVRPDKVVAYNSFFRRAGVVSAPVLRETVNKERPANQLALYDFSNVGQMEFQPAGMAVPLSAGKKTMPGKNTHNFELSPTAQKNLKEKITWLYHFAKNQTITTTNGKVLGGFKMNFVTLKLPSVQKHTSDFITKNCLNQLFIEIAKKYSFRNYVWRLEYQKNGNLHYHIATDTYIDFYWLRGTWNRVLEKYGYVTAYKERFENLTFPQYCKIADIGGATDIAVLSERYALGKRNGWRQPNSVDVKCVTNHKAIAFYIAKYMGKGSTGEQAKKLPVCEDNSGNSRLWFCSRSLSRLKKVSDFRECFNIDILGLLWQEPSVKRVVHDYCTTFYYNLRELSVNGRRLLSALLRDYGAKVGYV